MKDYIHQKKVYYKDVDKMGIVYYSRYLEYFEESRTELLSSLGLNVSDIEKLGIILPVISCHCEFKKGARFEDIILVRSWIEERPRSTLKISYEAILKKTNDLLVKGYTIHAFVNSNWKAVKPSYKILEKMEI
tara:strand:- start:1814 stop:2212 length:399 start_codon:yes stop_codon:yes gene_type:complete